MPSTELTLKGTTLRGPSSMRRTLEARSPELRPLSSYLHHRRTRAKQMRRSDNPTPRPRQSLGTSRFVETRNRQNAEPHGGESVRWSAGDENHEKAHSRNAANFCRDSIQPSSLSSGRIPFGMSSQRIVISVPPLASARLTVILISLQMPDPATRIQRLPQSSRRGPVQRTCPGKCPCPQRFCRPVNAQGFGT